jgi:O-succinylbenzoic acid--CoA ligase
MIIVTQERDIINAKPGDSYYSRVKKFIIDWLESDEPIEVQTSGSTGPKKTIDLSREQIKASVQQTAEAFDLSERTVFVCNLNLDFIAAKLQIIRALELNAELIVIHPSDDFVTALLPQRAALHRNSRNIFMAFVPMQLDKIIRVPEGEELLNMAGSIILGGAAVSQDLRGRIEELRVPVYATFGMTETVTHFAVKRLNGIEKQKHFVPLKNTEIKQSHSGTLMVKNACTSNEWITTNDRVRILPDQGFDVLGRADRVINSGGVKLSLDELEAKIDSILALPVPFFCAALPDEKLGERLVLFVESSSDQSNLLALLKENMPRFEVPKEVIALEAFYLTDTGKTDKLKTTHAYSVSN